LGTQLPVPGILVGLAASRFYGGLREGRAGSGQNQGSQQEQGFFHVGNKELNGLNLKEIRERFELTASLIARVKPALAGGEEE
jgi:hypothetical protein